MKTTKTTQKMTKSEVKIQDLELQLGTALTALDRHAATITGLLAENAKLRRGWFQRLREWWG